MGNQSPSTNTSSAGPNRLTLRYLRSVLVYSPEAGLFYWRKTVGRRAIAGTFAGGVTSSGYVSIRLRGRPYQAHRLAVFMMTGKMPTHEVDHRDGVRTNNKYKNLREATTLQNRMNRKLNSTNKSGFKGVSLRKSTGKWVAQISGRHIGTYTTAQQASDAYEKASTILFGKFKRSIQPNHA